MKAAIRYIDPAAFTLWQLNVLGHLPANDRWDWHHVNLAPTAIPAYWEWFAARLLLA